MKSTTDRGRSFGPANGPGVRPGFALRAALAAALLTATVGSASAAGITIEKPWMRLVIKARPAGGYFTLHNDTDAAVELTAASSSACGMVMLHQTKEVNGIEKMLPVKSITVPAHGTFSFHPGGYHIMCMKPQSSMVIGKNVPVILKFGDGKSVIAQFQVTGPGGINVAGGGAGSLHHPAVVAHEPDPRSTNGH
jgi:periplasmic copper chaperone A